MGCGREEGRSDYKGALSIACLSCDFPPNSNIFWEVLSVDTLNISIVSSPASTQWARTESASNCLYVLGVHRSGEETLVWLSAGLRPGSLLFHLRRGLKDRSVIFIAILGGKLYLKQEKIVSRSGGLIPYITK